MITELKLEFYPCNGVFGTTATYLSDGEPMSARFPEVLSVEAVRARIIRSRQLTPNRKLECSGIL